MSDSDGSLLIGIDEAGYGPNLGPLVVSATVWECDSGSRDVDLYSVLGDVLSSEADPKSKRLHVADSKQVYTPQRGIRSLEQSVMSALAVCNRQPRGLHELWRAVAAPQSSHIADETWYADGDFELPKDADDRSIDETAARWRECSERSGVRLRTIQSDIVLTERFNRLTGAAGSKGVCLSTTTMDLLRHVWDPADPRPALIVCDKHGGRNRYDELLDNILDGRMIFRVEEGRERSVYRTGAAEIVFRTRAEAHLPVALASMVSKYVREMCMDAFNSFWQRRLPDLKPTKGYPVDARRFREEIAELQQELAIPNSVLWRTK